jgi:hypothetical protein
VLIERHERPLLAAGGDDDEVINDERRFGISPAGDSAAEIPRKQDVEIARLAEFIGDKTKPIDVRVDRLFLGTLNRRPTDKERAKFSRFLTDGGSTTDAVWVLITCSEFRFNH